MTITRSVPSSRGSTSTWPAPTRYVVSPYLRLVPSSLADGLRHLVKADGEPPEWVIDALNRRLVGVTGDELAILKDFRGRAGGVARPSAGKRTFNFLVRAELLLPEDVAYRRHRYDTVEIEINRHCNFRCGFCPVKNLAKPRGFMTDELFVRILDRVREYGATRVSFNHYSEPTLDPKLPQKIALAASFGLALRLHTNASLLSEATVQALRAAPDVAVVVNLPSIDPDEFARATGSTLYARIMKNLLVLHEHQVPVSLSINARPEAAEATLAAINGRLEALFGTSTAWGTNDRAGLLDAPEYASPTHNPGRLGGCNYVIGQVNVAHDGQVFLCAMDYDQKYVLGNLAHQSLREIAESDEAVRLRRAIFGGDDPPPGFICSRCSLTRAFDPQRLDVGRVRVHPKAFYSGMPWLVSPALR